VRPPLVSLSQAEQATLLGELERAGFTLDPATPLRARA
jgi:hypothetical protein